MAYDRPTVKVFLDSNVILSGLISDRGAPRIILDLLCTDLPFLKGMTGEYNLMEVERNLKRKLPTALPVYRQYLPCINLEIVPLPTWEELLPHLGLTADKDLPVLVSAMNGNADFLVTGDRKDFDPLKGKKRFRFLIVSPSELLENISAFISEKID